MVPFVKALIEHFARPESRRQETRSDAGAKTSAPQRTAPPALVLDAMKWLPRPSLRTAAMIGAALAYLAARGRRRHAAPLGRWRDAVGMK